MSRYTTFIKRWIPPGLDEALKPLLGRGVFFQGAFHDWTSARAQATGYDADHILEKVKHAQYKVIAGEAAYERDSILFERIHHTFPVLTAFLYTALQHGGRLSVLDYGGALGSSYYQCLPFLNGLRELQWSVVEQVNFVRCGVRHFATDRLNFFDTIADCLEKMNPNVALLSSVLQYVPDPYAVLDEIMGSGLPLIALDRMPFSPLNDDFITIQHVPAKIYPATYPCWIFSHANFRNFVAERYDIMAEFDSADGQGRTNGTTFTFGGMILCKRD